MHSQPARKKFALIDMEYILKNIPAYEQANNQLNQASQQYQAEIEAKAKEAEALYKDYQKTASSLSAAQKSQKEEAIIAKEKSGRTEKEILWSGRRNG